MKSKKGHSHNYKNPEKIRLHLSEQDSSIILNKLLKKFVENKCVQLDEDHQDVK